MAGKIIYHSCSLSGKISVSFLETIDQKGGRTLVCQEQNTCSLIGKCSEKHINYKKQGDTLIRIYSGPVHPVPPEPPPEDWEEESDKILDSLDY